MAALPVVSGLDAIRTFERAGWRRARQKRQSRLARKAGVNVNLSVPLHREQEGPRLEFCPRLPRITLVTRLDNAILPSWKSP